MIRYDDIVQMHIELTSKCNAACPGCPRNVYGGYSLPWLDKDEWTYDEFVEYFPPELISRQRFILFCGNYGDPGVCKDLVEIVAYIKEHNWDNTLRIHTNGGMRTPTFWRELASVMNPKQDWVIFSIDGLEDTNHIYRRNVDWDRLMANANAFIGAGGRATWEYLIFGHNEHQIEEARAMATDMNFDDFYTKKAFGFIEEHYGTGVAGMTVHDKNGLYEYTIPAASADNRNRITATAHLENKPLKELGELTEDKFTASFLKNKEKTRWEIEQGHMSWLDEKREIDCMSMRNKEIYVDAQGGVHPCCFLGHVSQDADGIINLQYRDWIEENIGLDTINARKQGGIDKVVNSDYFEKIADTWAIHKHVDGRIAQCTKMCAVQHNPVKELYSELRNRKEKEKHQ